jgi:PAS domain S-box-containing protein
MTILDIAPTVTRFEWLCRMQLLRKQKSLVRVVKRRRKDGTILPVEVSVRLVELDRPYVVASVRDISERLRAEEQLREQARLLDQVTDAVIAAEWRTGQVTYWNHAAEQMFGVPATLALSHSFQDLLGGSGEEFSAFRTALEQQGKWEGELRLKGADEKLLTVRLRATRIAEAEGRPASVLLWVSDVSGLKTLEAQFLRAQRVEGIGSMASGMAHDLNNIFSPILMLMPLLRGEVTKEEKDSMLATIQSLAHRGSEIVRQVLTYARGADGKKSPVNLALTVDEVMEMAQETFPKTIVIEAEKDAKLWLLLGDATQLHQVLLNLVINARDAMPKGGTLRVAAQNFLMESTSASMLPGAHTGRYVRLTVADTGVGIPSDLHAKIFDPFFTTKEAGAGLGLGLSATLGIVRSHDGVIQLESEPGKGTTFRVYLPAMDAVPVEMEPEEVPMRRGHGELVLLVDDEAGMRGVGKAVLERMGYGVLLAAHGAEAVALYAERSREIAVVVTDAVMPILDGCALVRALRKLNPQVKVIGTSGFHYDTQTVAMRRLDLQAFLPKPFQASALLNVLDRVLHSPS